jgi:hypothetical protein
MLCLAARINDWADTILPKLCPVEIRNRFDLRPAAAHAGQPPKHVHRIRWWAWLTGFITILVSVGALIVSFMAYQDQHAADLAADVAEQQQYADQVAFWIGLGNGNPYAPPEIIVQNRGAAPISDVVVALYDTGAHNARGAYVGGKFPLGLIPPCTISSTPLSKSQADLFLGPGMPPQAGSFYFGSEMGFRSWITFTDADGQSWERTGDGGLIRRGSRNSLTNGNGPMAGDMPDLLNLRSTYKTTTGCS